MSQQPFKRAHQPAGYDLLMVGHFARDQIIVDGQVEVASGGGVYYGAIAARRLGASVAVATRLNSQDYGHLADLRQAGVEVYASPAGETSGIANYYDSSDMERRVTVPLGFAGPLSQSDLPPITARINAIVPIIAGEVDMPLLQHLAGRAPVALDIQGFVRVREGNELNFRPWPAMAEGLRHVTFLKVDRAEAELLTGLDDLARAAERLAAYGPSEIVVTESAGVTVWADGRLYRAPLTPRSLAGRTGRGDTCFATYLATRLTAGPERATCLAGAVTTLKQERPGPWAGSLADAEALLF